MKNVRLFLLAIIMFASYYLTAQVSINIDGTDPNGSAMLDVKSTDKGFLPPRVADTNSISNPVAGLIIYDQSNNCMRYFNGTVWSNCIGSFTPQFTCGDALVDTRDGRSYTTIQIGTQCWMAENLNYGTMINGISNQTDNSTIEKYCYDNSSSNCDTYGGLYQWDEMMQYINTGGTQGICPTGWHLPIDDEWCTLENHVDIGTITCSTTGWRGTDAGSNLKETGTTHWVNNTDATNSSGFTGLPGGLRETDGSFDILTGYAYFWSSGENGSNAWIHALGHNSTQVGRGDYNKAHGYSVRCVQD